MSRFSRMIRHKLALYSLFLFYALLHMCVFTLNNYATDDYMQDIYAQGSARLEATGLLKGIRVNDMSFFVNNQFNFFDPQSGNDEAMRNYGALPWWTKDGAMLHLWRPVSSMTHWIDYRFWPESPGFMQAHNGVWLFAGFLLVAMLFRKILPAQSVLVPALLVYGLDISIAPVVGWIAARNSLLVICFLALTLYFFHQSFTQKNRYVLALACFLLALLSAEAGIVVAAYLAAYALFFPVATLKERCLRAMPFAIMIIIWRWFYHEQGYGAFHIGQYIDPFRSPLIFLEHSLRQFPILFVEVVSGIDALEVLTPVLYLDFLSVTGWLLFALFLTVVIRLYKRQGQILFWFFATVLSLIPGLMTYSTDPRVVIYAHIGFSAVFALMLVDTWQQYRLSPVWQYRLRLWALFPLIFLQVVLQFIAILLMNYAVLATDWLKPQLQYEQLYGFSHVIKDNDNVVLINHRDVFRLMYYPYIAAIENLPVPQTLRQMNTAQTAIAVQRTSDTHYAIMPEGGFIFHPHDIQSLGVLQQAQTRLAGSTIKYATFFHDGNYRFNAGEKISLPEMDIVIGRVDSRHRPLVAEMRLHPGKPYRILYWDWSGHAYKLLPDLRVGEIFYIAGPQ